MSEQKEKRLTQLLLIVTIASDFVEDMPGWVVWLFPRWLRRQFDALKDAIREWRE